MVIEASSKPDLGTLSPLAREVASALSRVASNVALVVDPSGRVLRASEGPVPLEASCGSWEGRAWIDTATGESRHKIDRLLDEVRRDGLTRPHEVNHPTRGGVDIPLVWTAIRLGAGGPILAVGRDLRSVSEIQRRFMDAQHEMERDYWHRRHAEGRFRAFFHGASDALAVVDARTLELRETNEAARLLLGEQALPDGRLLMTLLPPAARAPVLQLLETVRHSGQPGEIRVALPEGGPGCDLSVTPIGLGEWSGLLLRGRSSAIVEAEPADPPEAEASRGGALRGLADLASRVGQSPLASLLAEATRRTERVLVQSALKRCGGLIVPAAALLGMSPEALLERLRHLGLDTPSHPSALKLN